MAQAVTRPLMPYPAASIQLLLGVGILEHRWGTLVAGGVSDAGSDRRLRPDWAGTGTRCCKPSS